MRKLSKQVLIFFLAGLLSVPLLGHRTQAQAQDGGKCANLTLPTPIAIPFNAATDSESFRPQFVQQSDRPCNDTQAILGQDDRIPVTSQLFPWKAIGRLEWATSDPNATGICTGTLIGKDLVVTNSHCLDAAMKAQNSQTPRIAFEPNLIDGSFNQSDLATVTSWEYGWKSGYQANSADEVNKDWALLKLDKPLGETYGYLGWRSLDLSDEAVLNSLQGQIRLAGYSGDFPRSAPANQQGNTASVHIGCSIAGSGEGFLIHNCDTMGGASGSALIARFDDGNYYIIGLHRGSNSDIQLSTQESCEAFDRNGNIATIGPCANIGPQVSQWATQAAAMRRST
ncbi:MAG TPA: trypsin-like peptidase domain-containing protein [Coleofasciculaceae cyanobacterium]|jgi:protease YdgD